MSDSSSSSSGIFESAWNQLVIYNPGYVQGAGNNGDILVGKNQLASVSTGIAGSCVDNSGNIYLSDPEQHIILRVRPNGEFVIYAGNRGSSGNIPNQKIKAQAAYFNTPMGLSCDPSGNLYVADMGNNAIRMITPDQYVIPVAGNMNGEAGYANGYGSSAKFNSPHDVAVDNSGNIYVSDTNNHTIRRITPGISKVVTVAGTGTPGDSYGIGTSSQMRFPFGIAIDPNGRVLIADEGNYKIKLLDTGYRLLKFSGSGVKGDFLGNAANSQYNYLQFMDIDRSGNLYVVDYKEGENSRLLKLNGMGVPAIIKDFASELESSYVVSVTVNNSGKVVVAESEYAIELHTSSSSSSSGGYSSSSSSSSGGYSSSSSSSSGGYSSSSSSSSWEYSSSSSSSSSSSGGNSSSSSSSSSGGYSSSSSSSSGGYSSSSSSSSSWEYSSSSSSSSSGGYSSSSSSSSSWE